MKHFLSYILFCVLTIVCFSITPPVSADNHCGFGGYDCSEGDYSAVAGGRDTLSGFIPLVGIPYVNTKDPNLSLPDYVNALYKAAISIAAFMAVVKIIFAGVKYMLSDVVTSKEDAKKDIRGALIGLLIVIGAVLILNTINPQLKGLKALDGPDVIVELNGDEDEDGTILAGSSEIIKEGDNVEWISLFNPDESRADCLRRFGTIVEGLGDSRDRCLIRLSDREDQLPVLVQENCPEGLECRAELCRESELDYFENCSEQCYSQNGLHYDETVNGCVLYDGDYISEEIGNREILNRYTSDDIPELVSLIDRHEWIEENWIEPCEYNPETETETGNEWVETEIQSTGNIIYTCVGA